MAHPTDIIPVPARKPPFGLWWTLSGFTASCLFGYGLVSSFLGDDAEMTTKEVAWIVGSMVAVWIAIPAVCYVLAHRFFVGLSADSGARMLLLYRRRGSKPLQVPFDSVTGVRADDDEFDDKMAAEAAADGLPSGPRPGQGVGVTNRELHHNLLVESGSRTYVIECHSKDAAVKAAATANGLLGR
jgi:hypothetical protein